MATIHEMPSSRPYTWNPNEEVEVRRWRVEGEVVPWAAVAALGIVAGDPHPILSHLYAGVMHSFRVPGSIDVVQVEIHYGTRVRSTRRVVGETEDRYYSEVSERYLGASYDDTPIILGEDLQGIMVPTGRRVWERTQWRAKNNEAASEELLWTRNDAEFEGRAIGHLLLMDHTCVELGVDYWQSTYLIRIDTRDSHAHKFYYRNPETLAPMGAEQVAMKYPLRDWLGLFA